MKIQSTSHSRGLPTKSVEGLTLVRKQTAFSAAVQVDSRF